MPSALLWVWALWVSSCFLCCYNSFCLSCDCCKSSCSYILLESVGKGGGLGMPGHCSCPYSCMCALTSPVPSSLSFLLFSLPTSILHLLHVFSNSWGVSTSGLFPSSFLADQLIFSGFPNSKEKETWGEEF